MLGKRRRKRKKAGLTVAVPSVLATRNCTCALPRDLLHDLLRHVLTHVRVLGLRGKGDRGRRAGVRIDQRLLPPVPFVEQLLRGRTRDYSWMGNTCKAYTRDVSTAAKAAFEVPNRFCRLRVETGGEKSSIGLFEDAGVAPRHTFVVFNVEDLDAEGVTGLRTLDRDRSGEVVCEKTKS